jgi:hypothetical protein
MSGPSIIRLLAAADEERRALSVEERAAMNAAIEKLRAVGARLPFPHQSQVKSARRLRELRPRAGRSPWRAFYRQVGPTTFVIAAIGPEAAVDPRGFRRAIIAAEDRLDRSGAT